MADQTPPTAPTDEPTPVSTAAPAPRPERPANSPWFWGTGRRKTAVARVRIRPGTGVFKIQIKRAGKKNGESAYKSIEEYLSEERDRNDAVAPLKVTGALGRVDVFVRVAGGGPMGQAGAIVLGVARALKEYDPAFEPALREHGFLTRDAREVERKKYGQSGARRRFQFSKR